jgi:hypothetical protein
VVSLFFVKLTSPGGRDREPHLPDGHSELHIAQLPQEIIDQGLIDAEWAKKAFPSRFLLIRKSGCETRF